MNEFIVSLNPRQREAVLAVKGPIKIIAGAGSGKTRVITYKLAYLIKYLNLPSWTICAVTFTNKACQEMKTRINDIIGEDANQCQIFTYHGLCNRILREEIGHLNYPTSFNILDANDQDTIIRKIYRSINETINSGLLKTVKAKISYWKNNFFTYEDALAEGYTQNDQQYAKIYQIYQKTLQEYQCLDFDDLLLFVYRLFSGNQEVLTKWKTRFNYFLVDEFQDTNDIQFEIIRMLVGQNHNITVVGDPDQTIYSWRGAKMSIIMNFEKFFPETETIILNQNYRSTQHILELANDLISNNQQRIKKDLFTQSNNGTKPVIFQAANQQDEATFVGQKINQLIKEENYQLADILILYRANYLSREVELVLTDYGLGYQIIGAFKFYERKEIKDCHALLRALVLNDVLSIERVLLNVDKLGQISVETIFEILKTENITLLQLLMERFDLLSSAFQTKLNKLALAFKKAYLKLTNEYTISDAFTTLIFESGYFAQIEDKFDVDRKENVIELIKAVKEFDQKIIDNNPASGLETAKNYLELIALQSNSHLQENNNKIKMMTIHNAKGLENKVVFIIGLNEGIFPTSQALRAGVSEMEEERRTFYVAITRAQELLFISYSGGYSFVTNNKLFRSRFIDELQQSFYQLHITEKEQNINISGRINKDNNFSSLLSASNKSSLKNDIKWKIGDELQHEIFGSGKVIKIIANNLQVDFNNGSKKIISVNSAAVKKNN